MSIGRSNPALTSGFEKAVPNNTSMTVGGTIIKTLILLAIVSVTFIYSWIMFQNPTINYNAIFKVSIFGGLILGLVTSFIPKIAQFTAIFYAAFEGVFLGAISRLFENMYPGIVFPAIMLTIAAAVMTLLVYRRSPNIADRIRKGVIIAMLAILAVLLISFILRFFGVMLPLYNKSIIGIGFNLFVVGVATLSLILDYDFILKSAQYGAPKYMEWYGAFGLMVTLIWLYTQILRLLAIFASDSN